TIIEAGIPPCFFYSNAIKKAVSRDSFSIVLYFSELYQHLHRILHIIFKGLQECSSRCSFYYTVITRKRYFHYITRNNLSVFNNRYFFNTTNSHNTTVRRINNRCKLFYSEHSQIRNCKGISFPVGWL